MMFRKKDEELLVTEPAAEREETAYEDNWYRSLKALSERQGADAADDGAVISSEVEEEPAEAGEYGSQDQGGAPEDLDAETDLETRAGHLLERLRTLQHLGDATEPEPETGEPSVWG